jgi:RNA polymerase sigma-70 factor (ECF subfamily)
MQQHTGGDFMPSDPSPTPQTFDDVELVRQIGCHDEAAFETLMRRHNGALFRVARAILHNDADAEDALQEAYLAAFRHLDQFRGQSKVSTWLTRIVINQALGRRRSRRRDQVIVAFGERSADDRSAEGREAMDPAAESPESAAVRVDMRRLLERRIDELPIAFRTVFMLREVSELSAEETATCLSIPEATVRTRLFRARGLLRESLARDLDLATGDVFRFAGERCDRVVAGVLTRWRARGLQAPIA